MVKKDSLKGLLEPVINQLSWIKSCFFLVAEDNTALIVVGSVMCVTTEIDLAVMILKIL